MRLQKLISFLLFALIISAIGMGACLHAQTTPGIVRIIYINGIQVDSLVVLNTTMPRLSSILDTSVNHPGNKRVFTYDNIYNPKGWNNGSSATFHQDSMELFLLKTAEEHYINQLQSLVFTGGIPQAINTTDAAFVAGYYTDMTPGGNSLESALLSPMTDADMAATKDVVTRIESKMMENIPTIFVAHSEANLLVNLAYASAASTRGADILKYVRVINLANTSRVSLHGYDLTHAGDVVVSNLLVNLPTSEGWTRTHLDTAPVCTPPDLITGAPESCTFAVKGPTLLGPTDQVSGPTYNHSIIDTYLSERTVDPTPEMAAAFTFTLRANRFRDRFEDFVYAAAASLDAAALLPVVQMLNPCVIAGEGQSVTLSATATSQVGTLSDLHWERLDHPEVSFSLPPFANNSTNGNTITSSVPFTTPFVSATTTFKIGFFAKDDRGMTSSGVAEVQVHHENIAPTITADARYTATTGTSVSLHASAQDTDGFLASASIEQVNNLSWLLLSSPQTLMTYGGNLGSWDIPVSIAGNVPGGTYTFRVTVVDNDGAISMRNIDLAITPNYFVDDFSTVSSVIGSHWAVNSFGSSAFVSGGELNLQHLVAQSMSLGTRAFHEGTNFRAYAKLSDGGSVRLTAGMDGMAIVQNLSTAPHRYQVQTWVTDPNTYETQSQYFDCDITPNEYHLFEYIYGLDGMVTLRVDQVALKQMSTTPSFFYGARMQFSYGQTLNGTGTLVQWAGVTP